MKFLLAAAVWTTAAGYSVSPPPGWRDATSEAGSSDVLLSLQGPESSSFLLLKARAVPLANRGAVRSYCAELVGALRKRSGIEFSSPGPLLSARYENGLSLSYVKAALDGKPRLVVGLTRLGGQTAAVTLVSNVPDVLLESLMKGLSAPPPEEEAAASSLDGQLQFSLPAGARLRPLSERERKDGFVAALEGGGAEIMVLKIVEEDAAPSRDQAKILRETALSFPGVDEKSLSAVQALDTPPGPRMIYVSAKGRGPAAGSEFVAAFLPWGYTGYSILGKGARPAELARAVFGRVALGSSAEPKIVAQTPRLGPSGGPFSRRGLLTALAVVGMGALLFGPSLFRR